MNKEDVAKLCSKQRKLSKTGLSAQYENTTSCQAFYDGDSMTYQDRIQFADPTGRRRRAMVNFNKVKENVDAVVGFWAQNRRQAKYLARVSSSEDQALYSRNMNSLYSYHRENTHSDQLETDQDADMMINGYGAIETDLSYIMGNSTTLANGEIVKVKLDPQCVGWDPTAKGKNLLDSRWTYYHFDYEIKEALELFQGSKSEDFEQVGEEEASDTGYVYNPWGGLYDKIKLEDNVEWASKEQEMVRVYNHQWMQYETFYRADNPIYTATTPEDASYMAMRMDIIKDGIKNEGPENIDVHDSFDFDPRSEILTFDEKTKNTLLKEFGDLIKPIGFKRKVFYTAVVSGDHVFTHFKSISQQGFSVKFKTGVYNNTGKFWVGMVNAMMEPQKYYNKALTELMFTIAANSKGGVMVEEGAVEDIADFETKWAKTDAVIKVLDGAISGSKIQQKAQGAVPTGLENIITLSAQAITTSGVDPAFLGQMDNEDQSGILYKRRIRQIISKMARYGDSISLYQKEDARLHGDLIPVWVANNNGQWVNITGEDGADRFVQITEDMLAPEYDVSIQEAPQTTEDKQQTASLLNTMGQGLIQFNPPAAQAFMAESLQLLPLDGDMKSRLIKTLQPQDQPDPQVQQLQQQLEQAQQIIQQLQSAQAQAQADKLKADARYSDARAQEAIANIESKTPLTNAQTIKTLEEAKRTAAEVDAVVTAPQDQVNVSV